MVPLYEQLLETGVWRPNGVLLIDNTAPQDGAWPPYGAGFMDPEERESQCAHRWRAVDAFNGHVKKDGRVEQVLLPVRDGMFLVRRKAGPEG